MMELISKINLNLFYKSSRFKRKLIDKIFVEIHFMDNHESNNKHNTNLNIRFS